MSELAAIRLVALALLAMIFALVLHWTAPRSRYPAVDWAVQIGAGVIISPFLYFVAGAVSWAVGMFAGWVTS